MKVTFIYHSCFLVETDSCYYLFDYYRGKLPVLNRNKPVFVFASHSHGDHYQPEVFPRLKEMGVCTIYAMLSDDIPTGSVPCYVNRTTARPNREYDLAQGQHVTTYRSTDQGTAFLIQSGEGTLYHAGDLNDWVWEGETLSCNEEMTRNYRAEIDKMAGTAVDIAFVVLDPRQDKDYARGILYFLDKVPARQVYPMHCWEKPDIITKFLQEYPQYSDKISYSSVLD